MFGSKRKAVASEQNNTFLVVGLGNPGDEYAATRHNAGALTIDVLAETLGANYWKTESGSITAKTSLHDHTIILAKPQSFMNVSGGPVKQLCKAYKVEPDHLIVIHDELDIDPGTVRVKFGGGHAGHNGLRSLCDRLQTRDWYRVRVGIGRPPGKMSVSDFVLSTPKKQDEELFRNACQQGAEATLSLVESGLEKTQQAFN